MDIITPAGNGAVRKLIRFFQALELLLVILLIVTPFTSFLYYFDRANNYVRSLGYPVWFYVTLVTFGFIGIIILLWYRKADVFFRKVIVLSTVIPLSAFLLDRIIEGISLNNIAVMITALIVFLLYEKHKVIYAIDSSTEMDRIQTRLTLSQIQPHFLYNVLQSIMYHADKDPKKTRAALGDFSKYLISTSSSNETSSEHSSSENTSNESEPVSEIRESTNYSEQEPSTSYEPQDKSYEQNSTEVFDAPSRDDTSDKQR